ncbi:STAS-like domain-containing protein [Polaribacter litorisediminis]|uniref:STAS-like domain-containing protein n=1 Tax=Polaribacter litorisediminis TaxID=1908341 RepID=UPI001CBB29C3|nr:DUF4325 domain-containing protein [Polaribacter litorisediminis]UAM98379.1 STAS-like domain-containing protein [Polaribacter litorisediminis]
MKTIVLKNIVRNSSSNEEGLILFDLLRDAYLKNEQILLDVDSNLAMSSSFLNTSIGSFLDNYGFSKFKETFKFKGSKSQFERLNNYISNYKELYLA